MVRRSRHQLLLVLSSPFSTLICQTPPYHSITSHHITPSNKTPRLPHNLQIHRPNRRHPLDRNIRRNKSHWLHNILHLLHRHLRPQMALDNLLSQLRFLPILPRRLHLPRQPRPQHPAIPLHNRRRQSSNSLHNDIRRDVEFRRQRLTVDYIRGDFP